MRPREILAYASAVAATLVLSTAPIVYDLCSSRNRTRETLSADRPGPDYPARCTICKTDISFKRFNDHMWAHKEYHDKLQSLAHTKTESNRDR